MAEKYIQTEYKQYSYSDEEWEEEETSWERMGIAPPIEDDDDEEDFEWVPILIRASSVWAISSYDGETVIWSANRSMSIRMSEQEAILKFFGENLDIIK